MANSCFPPAADASAAQIFGRLCLAAATLLGADAAAARCWKLRTFEGVPVPATRLLARDARAAGIGVEKKKKRRRRDGGEVDKERDRSFPSR